MTDEVSNSLYSRMFPNRSILYVNAENTSTLEQNSNSNFNSNEPTIAEPLDLQARRSGALFAVAMPLDSTDIVDNIQTADTMHITDERRLCSLCSSSALYLCLCPSFLLFIIVWSRYVLLSYSGDT